MFQKYDKFIISDRRTNGNAREMKLLSSLNVIGEAIHEAAGLTEFATRETGRVLLGSERAGAGERLDWELQYSCVQKGKYPFHDQMQKTILDEDSLRDIYKACALPTHDIAAESVNNHRPGAMVATAQQKLHNHVLVANIEYTATRAEYAQPHRPTHV